MDIKALINLLASPTILAGVGGYLGYRYSKKVTINNKYVGAGAGLLGGYMLGKTLQSFTQQVAPGQPVPQITDAEQPPQGDYLNLNLDAPAALPAPQSEENPWDQFNKAVQPENPWAPSPPAPQFSTSPANDRDGEGSYSRSSYNVEGIEDAMDEAELMLEQMKKN